MKSENRDKFQRNQVDTFTIDCVEFGNLYKIVLREDDTNVGADWFVASVSITDSKQVHHTWPYMVVSRDYVISPDMVVPRDIS